jgi:LacI family transcriptional regulator
MKGDRVPGSAKRVSARDVAALAGVSVTTVSRVLNDKGDDLAEATRERVRAAARELGYQANAAAVALRRGRTGTIGLVVPDIGDQYFHRIARGIEDTVRPEGYGIVFCNTDRVVAREAEAVELLLGKSVDGIVLCGGGIGADRHLRSRNWAGTRVVTIGPHMLDLPAVTVDDVGAIAALVEHLADGGRRRILCLAGDEHWLVSQERLAGYRKAVTELGLDDDPALVVHSGFAAEDGEAGVQHALDGGIRFDAVLAFNDYSALGAANALEQRGLRIPDDVAVAGCDDIDFASFARVPLTSVRFPTYDMGQAAVGLVLPDGATAHDHPTTSFGYELRIRRSTAPDIAART